MRGRGADRGALKLRVGRPKGSAKAAERRPVIVGSYNWTEVGAYDNDKRKPIIHDRELARACDAEWQWLWATVPLDGACSAMSVWVPVAVRE